MWKRIRSALLGAQEDRAPEFAAGNPSRRLVYEELRDQVDGQLRQIEALDAKAGTLLALSGGIAAVFLGWGLSAQVGASRGNGELTLLIEASLAGSSSIGAAYFGLWPRKWRRDPRPRGLVSEYTSGRYEKVDTLLGELASNLLDSFEENEPAISAKTRRLKVAQLALAFEVVFAATAVLAHWSSW